jgi:hypothetical protein
VTLLNQVSVKLCENDILGAKDQIDELLTSLDIKLVNSQSSSESLIPQYLIHNLVYFFLKTSKTRSPNNPFRKLPDGTTAYETQKIH